MAPRRKLDRSRQKKTEAEAAAADPADSNSRRSVLPVVARRTMMGRLKDDDSDDVHQTSSPSEKEEDVEVVNKTATVASATAAVGSKSNQETQQSTNTSNARVVTQPTPKTSCRQTANKKRRDVLDDSDDDDDSRNVDKDSDESSAAVQGNDVDEGDDDENFILDTDDEEKEEEEEEEEFIDDEEVEMQTPKKKRSTTRQVVSVTRTRSQRTRSAKKRSYRESSFSDDGDDDEDEEPKKPAAVLGKRRQHQQKEESSSRSHTQASPPRRKSPRRPTPKGGYTEDRLEDSSDDSDDQKRDTKKQRRRAAMKRRHKKTSKNDDDEEYNPDDAEEEASEDEEIAVWSSGSEEEDNTAEERKVGSNLVGEVNDLESIGTAEVDDDDDDDDDDDNTSGEQEATFPASPPPAAESCLSKEDAITGETLPKRHVCYDTPDGKTRHCFSLDTMRKIALTAGHPKFRFDLSGREKLTFLQPPHFRSALSDDILDQIASKFGRQALDLNGEYYSTEAVAFRQRRAEGINGFASSQGKEAVATNDDEDLFVEQVQQYVHTVMGSQDLYVCPVCYTVAHREISTLKSSRKTQKSSFPDNEEGDKKLVKEYPLEYKADPMTILGSLDGEEYQVASMICFRKQSQVKEHLRTDHGLDTKGVEHDLFAQYKIRVSDGLLQRYLTSGQRVYKVSPQSYWWEHKFDYVYLLNLVGHAEEYRRILAEHENEDHDDDSQEKPANVQNAEDFVSPALTFFESFSDIAGRLWNVIQEPFSKDDAAMDDFLDENEDDGGDTQAAYRALSMEEMRNEEEENQRLAEYYRRQMRGENDDDVEQEEEEEEEEEEEAESYNDEGAQVDTGALCDTSGDESDREHEYGNQEDDSSEVVVMEDEGSSSDDDFFRKQNERRGSIGRRKSETPKTRKKNRLQESKTPRKRRIIADDSEDE